MSENTNHRHRDATETVAVSTRTQLLRGAADEQLSDAQQAELARHLEQRPEDQAVIALEKRLRETVVSASRGSAPEGLRDRIIKMGSAAPSDEASLPFPAVGARPRFRFSKPVRWLAIAASLAILAGGAFVILRQSGVWRTDDVQVAQQYRTSLVTFIRAQHEECEVHADMIGMRFKTTKLGDVPTVFSHVLGNRPDIGHVEASGFKLRGAGPCAVPGRGESVRMVLESTADAQTSGGRGSIVSIHIQQDTGELKLESGKTYRLVDEFAPKGSAPAEIFVWRRDGFVYFLTSNSESAMQLARAAFGAEEPSETI
ncbi:MAG: hypothetical protein SGJ11_09280 [Phycisphaerae bacterium]|nr:hypothetical protein [Phycisphaerae bacterium]